MAEYEDQDTVIELLVKLFKKKLNESTNLSHIERNGKYFISLISGPPEDHIFIEETLVQRRNRKRHEYHIKFRSLNSFLMSKTLEEIEDLVETKINELQEKLEADDIRKVKDLISR